MSAAVRAAPSAIPAETAPPPDAPTLADVNAPYSVENDALLDREIDAGIAALCIDIPVEAFAAVVPDLADDVPEEERRAELRRALGPLVPEWAVDLAVNDSAVFSGEAGELLRSAVTTAVFTDRADVLRRLSKHLLEHGVDRFIALALLYGWAQFYCAPVPFEHEVRAVVSEAWSAV